jgi:hypothetical protein
MKEVNASNWIAVGMCHLKTIEVNKYAFGFSSVGHGAYMVSSNGGKILIFLKKIIRKLVKYKQIS